MIGCITLHDADTGCEILFTKRVLMKHAMIFKRSDGFTGLLIVDEGLYGDMCWSDYIVKESREQIIKMMEE